LQAAFTQPDDPKSAKRVSSLNCFLVLLGQALVKAAHITLVKSAPVVNFINIFCTKVLFSPKRNYRKAARSDFKQKGMRKMLVKSTPGLFLRNLSTPFLYTSLHLFFCLKCVLFC